MHFSIFFFGQHHHQIRDQFLHTLWYSSKVFISSVTDSTIYPGLSLAVPLYYSLIETQMRTKVRHPFFTWKKVITLEINEWSIVIKSFLIILTANCTYLFCTWWENASRHIEQKRLTDSVYKKRNRTCLQFTFYICIHRNKKSHFYRVVYCKYGLAAPKDNGRLLDCQV